MTKELEEKLELINKTIRSYWDEWPDEYKEREQALKEIAAIVVGWGFAVPANAVVSLEDHGHETMACFTDARAVDVANYLLKTSPSRWANYPQLVLLTEEEAKLYCRKEA